MENEFIEKFKQGAYKAIYVDVDGTLVIWPGPRPGIKNEGTPRKNTKLINLIMEWKANFPETELVIWSGNGAQHARWAAEYCGIIESADAILSKPEFLVDDDFQWFQNRDKLLVDSHEWLR